MVNDNPASLVAGGVDAEAGEGDPVVEGNLPGIVPLRIALNPRRLVGNFSTRFFSMGSCFARNVSTTLSALGFPAYCDQHVSNQFTSRTMVTLLERWVAGRRYQPDDLYRYAGTDAYTDAYLSPFHKTLGARGPGAPERLIAEMEARDAASRSALANADVVLITVGTATYLRLCASGGTLSYSYNVPRSDYQLVALSVSELRSDLDRIYECLGRLVGRPFHLVLTVSPQRYNWPAEKANPASGAPDTQSSRDLDPLTHSNLDKAKLRVAIDDFVQARGGDHIEYFPSFDIVMDELRQQETFNNDPGHHLHVAYPTTANYVINRFLHSHCTEPVITALQDFRRGIGQLERRLPFDLSPTTRARVHTFVRAMRAHRDRVGCHVLYDRVREALRQALDRQPVAETVAAPEASSPRRIDDPVFTKIRTAHERLQGQAAAWRASDKRVVIFGAGRHTEMLLRVGLLGKANVAGICDDYPEVDEMLGIPVAPFDRAEAFNADVIVVSSVAFQTRMQSQLAAVPTSQSLVYPVYMTDELPEAQRWMPAYESALQQARSSILAAP